MKAARDSNDYFHMKERPLPFTVEDVELSYLGLAAQQERAMLGFNADQQSSSLPDHLQSFVLAKLWIPRNQR